MSSEKPLDRLCDRCGIEREYWDCWGQRRYCPESTKLALLNAMGVAIGHADEAAAALAALEERDWRELLPPAKVVHTDRGPIRLTLTLPAACSAATFDWLLELENGECITGQLVPESLDRVGARDVAGVPHIRCEFELPVAPATGYHHFELIERSNPGRPPAVTRLIVCPERCFQPPGLDGGNRIWGLSVQVYAVRSRRNWGMGDFGDLGMLTALAAGMGAGIVGVNPLHAMLPGIPQDPSPYRPSNRSMLNILYLDIEAIADLEEAVAARGRVQAPEFQAHIVSLRGKELIDYRRVAELKLEILELLYRSFRERHLVRDTERAREFRAFQETGGELLHYHALYDALQEHFSRDGPGLRGWLAWPEPYRSKNSEDVSAFAIEHAHRVEYFQYLQWQADLQLGAVARRTRSMNLPVGLYLDLAVGVDPGGAETWIHRGVHALDVRVGAPPDELNLNGQEWGLPPWIPRRLVEQSYAPFVETLRNVMRHADAIRIDHVMGLMRLFWVPEHTGPAEGTYVMYPFEDLQGILALESQRNRCLVVGEDLGTVPDAVRAAMANLGMLAYRPMYFERTPEGDFKSPRDYTRDAVVAISTHDLPTLKGYWLGADLATRRTLELFPTEEIRARQFEERARDRSRLLAALAREGLLPAGMSAEAAASQELDDALVRAVHAFVGRAPSRILMVQLEDLFGQVEQVNVPGTTGERYPNWCRKLPGFLEDWPSDARVTALARVLRNARGDAPSA